MGRTEFSGGTKSLVRFFSLVKRSGVFCGQSRISFAKQNVCRAPSARLVLFQDSLFDQILDVPKRRVVGSLRKLSPFFRRQFLLEPVEQHIDNVFLPFADFESILP